MTTKYTPTIGLEVHVELKTKTKMFCQSKNDPDETRPNVNICPICLAHPGTLPVINKQAVKHVLRVGEALGGKLADFTEFDRKNYFYPDIPKAYQISQYKYPLVSGGKLAGVDITRVHLEEDTARSQHDNKNNVSLVDFNRAGVPLMELVTEPVMHSAVEVGDFARELKILLSPDYLDVSEANLEKGEMRIEANISVSTETDKLGMKVEVKNLNSFKAVEKAIAYEVDRQTALLEAGETVSQETRGWDENKEQTFSQRKKEFSHDYRYFPDPDLPKLYLQTVPEFQNLSQTIPELPNTKRERLLKTYNLKIDDVETFIRLPKLAVFFEQTVKDLKTTTDNQIVANLITSDILGLATKIKFDITTENLGQLKTSALAELVDLYTSQQISSRGLKDILVILVTDGGEAKEVATAKNLFQTSNEDTLITIIKEVMEANPEVASDFKSGNEKVLQYLVGQGMKLSAGSANPQVLAEMFKQQLN